MEDVSISSAVHHKKQARKKSSALKCVIKENKLNLSDDS